MAASSASIDAPLARWAATHVPPAPTPSLTMNRSYKCSAAWRERAEWVGTPVARLQPGRAQRRVGDLGLQRVGVAWLTTADAPVGREAKCKQQCQRGRGAAGDAFAEHDVVSAAGQFTTERDAG